MSKKKAFALRIDEQMLKAIENGLPMNSEAPMGRLNGC